MGKLAMDYADTMPVGVFGLNNFGGLEVLDTEDGDHVVTCFNYGDGRTNFGRQKVEYTASGRAYFRKHGARYYLDDIMGC